MSGGRGNKMRIKFDAMMSHDITYVGIIQTARASGLERFPLPYAMTNCHNSLCAVGGTINIITKDPINNSFQVSSMFSNMDGKSWEQYMGGNVSLVAKDNSYGIAFYESYRNRNPYDRDGDGFSELGKLNMNTFGFRAYYRPTHFSRINLEYHTTNELRRGGTKFDLQPHETDLTEQTKKMSSSFLYNGTRRLFERLGFTYDRPKGLKNCVMVKVVDPA